MSAKVREIVDDALEIIGEVAGVGVQEYEDDVMRKHAVRGFNMLFKKRFWEPYTKWYQLTLDGILGIVTTDAFEKVIDFEDFGAVYRDGQTKKLPVLTSSINPYTVGSGNMVRFWTSLNVSDVNYAKRKLQFYPKAATGLVNVVAREYPLEATSLTWDWEDRMYLDRDLLAYAAAFATLSGDDLNTNAANVVEGRMNDKFKDIMTSLGRHPMAVRSNSGIPTYWTERLY